MLQSFLGTIDECGLRTLTPEPDEWRPMRGHVTERVSAIWAVLDSSNLQEIQEALAHGQRRRAMLLLSTHARSLGSVLD